MVVVPQHGAKVPLFHGCTQTGSWPVYPIAAQKEFLF